MITLTPEQIKKAKEQGVTDEQIKSFVNSESLTQPEKVSGLEKIGSLAGLDVLGKTVAQLTGVKKTEELSSKFMIAGDKLMELSRKEKDPTRKKKLLTMAQDNYKQAGGVQKEVLGEIATPSQIAGSAGKLGLTLGTLGTPGIAKTLGGRMVEGGVIGASFQALDNLQRGEKPTKGLKTAGVIGAAIPFVGTALTRGLQKFSGNTAQKIEQSLIKPNKVDLEDGFSIKNVQKYGITGNLTQKLQKVETKLSNLTQQLRSKINRSDAVIDLNDIADKTAKSIMTERGKMFGNIAATKNAIQKMANEIELYSKNGLVDLPEAQVIKQNVGKNGAWIYGFVDPDAKASEFVYSKFYRILKEEIEKKAPQGVKEINKQISDLIPISNAIIRRIPIAERNNTLSLTDIITGGFAIGNPKAIGLFALNRALKSGNVANFLAQTEQKLGGIKPKSNILKRIIGQ